jgi:hypothetical protein
MWLRGVCITRMETGIEYLTHFQNQQVVLNFYENDELVQRDGIRFESVEIADQQLLFKRGETVLYSLPLNKWKTFRQRTEFKNYFILENKDAWIDIYFP